MVEHDLAMVGVAGSNPVFRFRKRKLTSVSFFYTREIAQLGRALRSGHRGRKFESCFPDHVFTERGILDKGGCFFFDGLYLFLIS